MKNKVLFWFRRDLRLNDNAGLYHALSSGLEVQPIFIFDKNILDRLEDEDDGRVSFIHQEITRLSEELQALGASLNVYYSSPGEVFQQVANEGSIQAVYTNHDYEPYAKDRDESIRVFLNSNDIEFATFKDQVIFEKDEVLKDNGTPYTVFTPYSKKWKEKLSAIFLKSYPTEKHFDHFCKAQQKPIPTLEEMGFRPSAIKAFPRSIQTEIIRRYGTQRDLPARLGTSRLSVHLRFGTVSIRQLASQAKELSEVWLNELIWRDFYHTILWHFPHAAGSAFKPAYNHIEWRNNPEEFLKWCEGKTGYPIVDAGMRELNATGFMHNRVRMIVASFLTKHLLIDWRWGEAWFARKLMDFDLAANNGGWQWAAGSGCDAAPYFRVFNPALQTERFDPQAEYIRRWVPEFDDLFHYPRPIVDHKMARERALATYKAGLLLAGDKE
jgi:deoxyribodipyrimidine photo-lyase